MVRAVEAASCCFLLCLFFWISRQTAALAIRERIAVTGGDAELLKRTDDRDWLETTFRW
jgi:hypothetical protein